MYSIRSFLNSRIVAVCTSIALFTVQLDPTLWTLHLQMLIAILTKYTRRYPYETGENHYILLHKKRDANFLK